MIRKKGIKDILYWGGTRPSQRTMEEDVHWLLGQTEHVFRFCSAPETPEGQQYRIRSLKKRERNYIILGCGFFTMTVGTMVWGLIFSQIPLYEELKGTIAGGIILLIPAILSFVWVCNTFKRIFSENYIYVDNITYQEYELRKMNDGALVLIHCPNFERDSLLGEYMMSERSHFPFSSLLFLQNVTFYENKTHLIVDCDIWKKRVRMYGMGPRYWEGDRAQLKERIYIQKGTYPENMMELLGYTVYEMKGERYGI